MEYSKKGKIAGTSITILIALVILSISFLKSPSINRAYSPMVLSEKVENEKSVNVDYLLAYPGEVNPDNPLWYLKVIRDKAWYAFTFDVSKKTELNLLFADKRLSSALYLFQNNKPDLGLSTLTKAEKYLEKSLPQKADDKVYLEKLALASLKHRLVIEKEILVITPEDLRPEVIIVSNYSKETYKKVRDLMYSIGLVPPENIFELK